MRKMLHQIRCIVEANMPQDTGTVLMIAGMETETTNEGAVLMSGNSDKQLHNIAETLKRDESVRAAIIGGLMMYFSQNPRELDQFVKTMQDVIANG